MMPLFIRHLNVFKMLTIALFNSILLVKDSTDSEEIYLFFVLKKSIIVDNNFVLILLQWDRLIAILFPYYYQYKVCMKLCFRN